MFKKLYKKIETLGSNIKFYINDYIKEETKFKESLYNKVRWITEHDNCRSKYIDTIVSQQRTVEALTNALCDKYNHGLFIYSEDGNVPMVIRNGKELTNDMTTEFSICWCPGEAPSIQIEQVAATHHEDGE